MDDFSKEEISSLLYFLRQKRDNILNSVKFFNEVIKDKENEYRLGYLNNCVATLKKDLYDIDLLILKIQNFL